MDAMCFICFDADASPAPIQSGCACRGEAGLAHVGCRVQAAEAAHQRGYLEAASTRNRQQERVIARVQNELQRILRDLVRYV